MLFAMSPPRAFFLRRRALAALLLAGGTAGAQYPDDNLYATSFALKTPAGQRVDYPAVAGRQPSVLMFWPAWCPYSHALLPYLQDLQNDYRAAGVKVWLVSVRAQPGYDPVEELREHGYDLSLLLDGDAVMREYRVEYTPWLIVVDGDRNTRYTRPPRPDSPIEIVQGARQTLNLLLGAKAVALPSHYPPPESRGWQAGMASALSLADDPRRQAPPTLPEVLWAPWVENYLAGVGPQESVPGEAPRGPVPDGKTAIAIARELWTAHYGAHATRYEAPYRAYRLDNQWLVMGAPPQRALGEGMVLVIEQDSGRVRRLAAGRALSATRAATALPAAAGPASAGTRR